MSKKNTGLSYEKLTQTVFHQIINQNSAQTIHVQHDVTLQGKTTTHQLDVYWEFELSGIKYCTAIQAKDWKNKVPQKEMLAFKAILDDLPGTTGVYVSKTGYQSGAKNVAIKNNIKIYELRAPIDKDFDGLMTKININLNFQFPNHEDLAISLDENWIKSNSIDASSFLGKQLFSGNSELLNREGIRIFTVSDLIYQLCDIAKNEKKHLIHEFMEDTFIKYNNNLIKIKNISGNFWYSFYENPININAEDIISLILKDITNGSFDRFDKGNKLL